MGVDEVVRALGVASDVPLVGYVFDERWAEANRKAVDGFVRAIGRAKDIMSKSDDEWERLRPLMKAGGDDAFLALRDAFRRGIPTRWGAAEQTDARRLFDVLAKLGGTRLVGRSTALQDGTFWPSASD